MSELKKSDLESFQKTAIEIVDKASRLGLEFFNANLKVEEKPDQTLVTQADRGLEECIREELRKSFPSHSIMGEEYGEENNSEDFKWWIDPIDGTHSFVRKQMIWGIVLGLEYRGEIVTGVIDHPVLNLRLWAAKNLGCFANGKPCQVSKVSTLADSTFYFGGIKNLTTSQEQNLLRLSKDTRDHRGWGDTFGHSAVIQGLAEAMIDFHVNPYDISAIKICVEEAGGVFSGLNHEKSIYAGSAVSSNGKIHSKVLDDYFPTN